MAKTYVPALIKRLRKQRVYINKHLSTMTPVLSGAQVTALSTIVTAIAAFDGVVVDETP